MLRWDRHSSHTKPTFHLRINDQDKNCYTLIICDIIKEHNPQNQSPVLLSPHIHKHTSKKRAKIYQRLMKQQQGTKIAICSRILQLIFTPPPLSWFWNENKIPDKNNDDCSSPIYLIHHANYLPCTLMKTETKVPVEKYTVRFPRCACV